MTHSLKVAQIARRLAEYFIATYSEDQLNDLGGLDPDVAETAGLCHDIGHPPFGHTAEDELEARLEAIGEPDGFEGNAQSFRIVTKLSRRYLETHGENLTAATLCAILKYPWARSPEPYNKRHKKYGCYASEVEDFTHARSFLRNGDERQSLEANIMDWADDISYAVHDVDDAFRAGLVPLDRLVRDDDERERFLDWYAREQIRREISILSTEKERQTHEGAELARLGERKAALHDTLAQLVSIPHKPRNAFRNTREDIVHLHHYSSTLLTRYVTIDSEHLQLNAARSSLKDRLLVPPTLRNQVNMLKNLMVFYVYESPTLVAQQVGQRAVVRELFFRIHEAVMAPSTSRHGLIPEPFREALRESHTEKRQTFDRDCARLATDIICSLTDQQAVDYYRRLTGHFPGSIRDQIVY